MPDLGPEDAKLVTLARASRARAGAAEGAAVRDSDGRTYTAATVSLPSLSLSALQAAVVLAASSGVTRLAAAAIVGEQPTVDAAGAAALSDLGSDATLIRARPDGSLSRR
ncbi:MAG: cytidine deaminase [Mycobacteriales bacterium]|nr:MAG: cytidine deaminase [Pseudonocardiales bacterium]